MQFHPRQERTILLIQTWKVLLRKMVCLYQAKNAGSVLANISDTSPYPKFEQSGIYSVDADTYKYVEINLTNNSPKNRVTFVSPNGGKPVCWL